MKTTEFSVLWC